METDKNGRPTKFTRGDIVDIYTERKNIFQEQLKQDDVTPDDRRRWNAEIVKCDRIIVANS
jgi:hypothetical protein